MPDVYDENGNKVEGVLTKEEHEAQLAENAKKVLEEAEKSGLVVPKSKLDTIEKDLETAKEALKKFEGKDMNFEKLREAKEAAENNVKQLQEKFDKEISGVKELLNKKETNDAINALADGDLELAKKIKYHFNRIVRSDDNEEERAKKLADSFTLAVGRKPSPGVLAGIPGAAGAFSKEDMIDKNAGGSLKPELVPLAHKLGLSDADLKKHGGK